MRGAGRRRDLGELAREYLEPFHMMDLVYLVLTGALLALSWGFVRLCDRV